MNELFGRDEARTGKRVGMLHDILKRALADDGSCIIIEPALRETSREMLEVRDGLLEQGLSPLFPVSLQREVSRAREPQRLVP